jgi:hypothetical protein
MTAARGGFLKACKHSMHSSIAWDMEYGKSLYASERDHIQHPLLTPTVVPDLLQHQNQSLYLDLSYILSHAALRKPSRRCEGRGGGTKKLKSWLIGTK